MEVMRMEGKRLSLVQIKAKCVEFSNKYWGYEFKLPVELSSRMTHALGYYQYKKERSANKITPMRVKFAERLMNGNYSEATIDSVIKHELAHWALSLQGVPFSDGDWIFKNECRKIGASLTGTIDHSGSGYCMVCEHCGRVIVMKDTYQQILKYINGNYKSKCCKSSLKYVGYRSYEDTNAERLGLPGSKPQPKTNPTPIPTSIPTSRPVTKVANQAKAPKPKERTIAAFIDNFLGDIDSHYTTSVNISTIIKPGTKVTNKLMIELMKQFIAAKEADKLKVLRKHHQDIFDRSIFYLHVGLKNELKSLIG
jgi:predicted SprT family Zn-dependent metalloprotease